MLGRATFAAALGGAAAVTALAFAGARGAPVSYTLVELTHAAGPQAVGLLEHRGASRVVPELRLYRLRTADAARVLPRLRALGVVRHAGLDREAGILAAGTPTALLSAADEPLFATEWWRGVIGVAGLEPPGPGVPVTVVDSGIDLAHPEFAGRADLLTLNAQEPAPVGGRHGTGVASLVGAPVNGVGISGVYPQVKLRSWDAALGEGLQLRTSDIVAGILAATREGKGVVNLSLGGPGADPLIRRAVAAAVRAGVLVVAAAGNDGANGRLTYPASYPHVLTVGSIGQDLQVSGFSSQSRFVDLVAPGSDITSAWPVNATESPDGYRTSDGTSFAAPLVSGAAAWVWTVRPELDATQVFELLRRSARDIGPPGRDNASGLGVLDVGAALAAPAPVADPLEPNETPDELRAAGLAQGIAPVPPLTTAGKPTVRIVARLTAYEDPRDLYRIWIPRGWKIAVTTQADTDVDLSLWRGTTTELTGGPSTDRLARASTRGTNERLTYVNTGAGAAFLLSAVPGKGVTGAEYSLRVARVP